MRLFSKKIISYQVAATGCRLRERIFLVILQRTLLHLLAEIV
jgi:hypothetical protein